VGRVTIGSAMKTKIGLNDACYCGSGRKYKKCHKAVDEARADRKVIPGVISPPRGVPPSIPRPDYADGGEPGGEDRLSIVTTSEDLARLRRASQAAAEVLAEVGALVQPGITTDSLDAAAHEAIIARGGYPSPLYYRGFPKSLCTSVNEVICHGIPDDQQLQDGDIVNLDVTVFLDGMHGDTNATFLVGEVDETSRRLVRVTEECLERAIAEVRPGVPVNVIGKAIEQHAKANRFEVVRAFIGHAVGEMFHGALHIPHYYEPRATTELLPGMAFTIEPMIAMGTWRHLIWDDGWTAVTADGRRTAQFEHTLVVTDDGCDVLTRL
jgi:methionyl aminopeptidase